MTVNQHNAANCPGGVAETACHCGSARALPLQAWWAGAFKDAIASFGRAPC